MVRIAKYGLIAVSLATVGGFLLFGMSFPSYLRTSANSVRETVTETVPIEFELRRTRDLIDTVLPDMQAQVRVIAQEEVAIAGLEAEIAKDEKRLDAEQATLLSLRNQMRAQQASFEVSGTKLSREQVTEQIQQRFERFKQGELTLQSKQRLLEKRNEGLAAALAMLDRMRHRKAELELKVESLAAQYRLVRASAIELGSTVDASRLSEADQLLNQLETRLAVAQRIITYEQDDQIEFDAEPVNEQQVLLEYDQYFENVDADQEPLGPSGVKLTVQNE
jgi:hypothetical protein